ncbi:MAG: BLUF domain-containing protein [Kangiellaceae bacterium]|jgi:hypothetical protein|nr:BLUF domain-containing protein [Kangiellaceae bacterium]
MFLVRTIYVSEIVNGFDADEVEKILIASRKNNKKVHVTGLLVFSNNYFIQCLEGSRTAVNSIYHTIMKDPRHENVIMLDYSEIITREFGSWSMGYIPTSSVTSELNMRYSGNPDFNPYEMKGESVHKLLIDLSNTLPTI